ncbi:PREDICTED: DEAD-box ATP-dependent RNA helicase 41 [Tarenaya hassleriana]|uniref:DEAD-box ATP-dependent RNA helicase 41 n=1 Tax=Tarenaya hassleriana TaxID=28532 RepID=UPI00053C5505|nr:PREDICTED: DEAD-box ATP-dependent RNA helicase 41 [Tarenaya hassleriana]
MNEDHLRPQLPEDGIKQKSVDQRAPLPGDPKCVICSRYGEYICDETDDDICSLECKQRLLRRLEAIPVSDECFYVRDDDDDAQLLRSRIEIDVKGGTVPPPALSFDSFGLPSMLRLNLETAGYRIPTPIQMQAIPAALTGKNLLVSASTGSGKTVSFLVPIVSRCASFRSEHPSVPKGLLAIVLTPTRELCIQVEEQAKMLGKGLPFKTALVVGGDPMSRQLYRIQQGVELIIATPGRLIDLLTKHDIELDHVTMFVLDEVDCLLQRGFRDQVMQIFRALSQPQVLLYSATISKEVEKVAASLSKDMIEVSVGEPNRPSKAVRQLTIWVETKRKKQKLFEILRSQNHYKPPAVVYVSSRIGADLLAEAITTVTGIRALSIHGEKLMKDRRDLMGLFLSGEVPVLVSTGILGRGVDLLGVRQVIVFDMPDTIEEYIHQIGRASRIGEEGTAILFVNEENRNLFPDLVAILKSYGAPIPRELSNFASMKGRNKKRRFGH